MKYILSFILFTICFISFSQNKTETKTVSYNGYIHSLIYNETFAWLLLYESNNNSKKNYFKKIFILKFDLEQNSFLKKEEIKVSNFTEKGEHLYRINLIDNKVFGLFGMKKNNLYEFYLRNIDFERENISSEKSEVVAKMDNYPKIEEEQLKITSSSNDVYYGFYSNISNSKTVNHQVNIYNSETKEWKRKHFKTNTKAAIYPKIFIVSNNGSFLIAASENKPGSYSSSTTFAYCFDDEINIKEFKYKKIKTAVVTAEASKNNTFLIKIVANGFNNILFEYWRHITPEKFGDRKLFRDEKIDLDGYGTVSHHNKSIVMTKINYPYLYPCVDGSFFMIEKAQKKMFQIYYNEKDENKKISGKLYKISESGEIIWKKDNAYYGDILCAYVEENKFFVLYTQHNMHAKNYTDVIKFNSISSDGEINRIFTFQHKQTHFSNFYLKIGRANKFIYLLRSNGSVGVGVLSY